MKVGIFDPYLDDLGGGEKYMMTIAQCLTDDGHDVHVFWDHVEDIKELKIRFSLNLSKVKFVNNIFSRKEGFLKRLWKTKNYDVIIILSDGSIPFTLAKKTLIHFQQPISKIRLNLKDELKIKRVKKFFCNSKYTKSYIDKSLNIESFVLYPPVKLRPKEIKKENIILHVGRFRVKNVRFEDYKKQGFMISTFKQMVRSGFDGWEFVLAVSIKEKERKIFDEFKKSAENFPIKFLINNTNDELWDIYSKAKIYWHASGFGEDLIKHPEFAEHFGISTVEAMGAGAVPVVFNAGGQKEIVEDGKNGFLWDTVSEFKEKTLELVKEDKLWERLSRQAQKRAEFFAGDRFCKEVKQLIS